MRIAYVSLHWPRKKTSGVGRKIEDQISAWRKNGHVVQFFSHRTEVPDPEELVGGESFIYAAPTGKIGKIVTEFNRCLAVFPLIKALRAFAPDLIYLRWSMYVFPSHLFFTIAPVVLEVNTNDVSQHEMLGPILSTYNKMTRGIYYANASGLVFVSNEMVKSKNFSRFAPPKRVITNGINLEENLPLPAPQNERPRLGFIGTPKIAWQGEDKLVRLAELCPDVDIDIIGFDSLDGVSVLPPNLHLYGYLNKEKSRYVLSKVDVGIGTLALHRKAMEETSALKICEYLAYGIPIILPYQDTALIGLNLDTILRIPNTETSIEDTWMTIRDFAYRMKGRRVDRNLVAERIGTDYLEATRLEFFQECFIRKSSKK